MNGDSHMYLKVGQNYTEPGATATDDQDGDLTTQIQITGAVDTTQTGAYTITYQVSDS